jgi:hypothetical protein
VIIFGFRPKNLKTQAVAVAFSMAWQAGGVEPQAGGCAQDRLAGFRRVLYGCFTARKDALFELADAVVCRARATRPRPVTKERGLEPPGGSGGSLPRARSVAPPD